MKINWGNKYKENKDKLLIGANQLENQRTDNQTNRKQINKPKKSQRSEGKRRSTIKQKNKYFISEDAISGKNWVREAAKKILHFCSFPK